MRRIEKNTQKQEIEISVMNEMREREKIEKIVSANKIEQKTSAKLQKYSGYHLFKVMFSMLF